MDKLEYPDESWTGFLKNHFGPSIVWALLGIGGSHIVLGPTMGSLFGLFAIWLVTLIFLVKYGAWSLGIRYNYTVGKDLITGYKDLPGPKNWALWLSALVILTAVIVNTAAIGLSGAAFLLMYLPLSLIEAYALLIILTVLLVAGTNYSMLERILMSFIIIFVVLIVLGALLGPPSADVIAETTFDVPDLLTSPYLVVFAGAAGLMPTLISSSLFLSSWSLTKNVGLKDPRAANLAEEEYDEFVSSWLRTGLRDFRIGYLFSYVFLIAMVVLAANVLYPGVPGDQDIEIAIAEIFTETYGEWAFHIVIIGALAALWSTVITALDGGSRAILKILDEMNVSPGHNQERRILVVVLAVLSALPVIIVGQVPVTLVVLLGVLGLVLEVYIYPANLYLVLNKVPEKHRPSRQTIILYLTAIGIFALFAILGAAEQAGIVE